MKIILISTGSRKDKGPKIIAEFLEKNNHKIEIHFSEFEDLDDLKKKAAYSGLIVVSANKTTYRKASKIFKALKRLQKPVAYAGIYPSLHPEKAIEETDLVITKNPKETILELANRLENFRRVSDIESLWFKAGKEKIMKNE